MTAQFQERILYQGTELGMSTLPLEAYFDPEKRPRPDFDASGDGPCTACRRGYIGTWQIEDDRLSLLALIPFDKPDSDLLPTVLPDATETPIAATWYSGTLRIPQGRRVEYVHSGFASIFETELMLKVERGLVVATEIKHNAVKDRSRTAKEKPRKNWIARLLNRAR